MANRGIEHSRRELEKLKIHRTPTTKLRPTAALYRKRLIFLVALLTGIAAMYVIFTQVFNAGVKVETGTVSTAYPGQQYTLFNATGYVVPQRRADIASKATGRLETLMVEEGSYVNQGDIIAHIENKDVLASRAQAKANVAVAHAKLMQANAELENATITLERMATLASKKYVNQADYDTAEARHDKAVAAVAIAKANILAAEAAYRKANVAVEYTFIRAPFNGVILEKHADLGDVVAPFSSTMESKGAVVTMADMHTLQVEADVSESNLMQVHVGQPCEIQLDALPGERFRGQVHMIVPTVDRTKATVLVKVRFLDKDSRILPDMSARVAFLEKELSPEERQPHTAVPTSALVMQDGQAHVFHISAKTAHKIPVKVGQRLGERVIIESPLNAGDKVVINPPGELRDATPVVLSSA